MKTSIFTLIAILSLGLSSCSSSDDKYPADLVSEVTKKALEEQYPDATKVEWKVKGDYLVAEFYLNKQEVKAWYNNNGNWYMTETDISYAELSQEIKEAIKLSKYADWKVDDVDKVERKESETLFVVEVEKGKLEVDLYYTIDGILVVEKEDNDNNNESILPQTLPVKLKQYIDENHAGARIIEFEISKNTYIEVEIIEAKVKKELLFDITTQAWIQTKWDVKTLPQSVLNSINDSDYSAAKGWKIDDMEQVVSPKGTFYLVEFEKGEQEISLLFDTDGAIVA